MAECLKINRSSAGGNSFTAASWSDGTYDELAAMLSAAYAGDIDIYDYWSVGARRSLTLPAISGFTDSETAFNLILGDKGYQNNNVKFVVLFDNAFNSRSENYSATWTSSGYRTLLNSTLYNNLPAGLKSLLKQFTYSHDGNEMTDYLSVVSYKELVGTSTINSTGTTGGTYYYDNMDDYNAEKQFEYFKTPEHRALYKRNVFVTTGKYADKIAGSISNGESGIKLRNTKNSYGVICYPYTENSGSNLYAPYHLDFGTSSSYGSTNYYHIPFFCI